MHPISIRGSAEGKDATAKKIHGFGGKLHDDLRTTVKKLGYDLEALVKRKLSGPVLKAVTGILKGSVNTEITETRTSITASVGTSVLSVPYARIHEWGGIIVPKTADYLVFKTADGAWHKVKQVTIPERSYLRSSLGEKKETIESEIRGSAARAAKASGF